MSALCEKHGLGLIHEKKSGSISQCLGQGIGGKQIQVAHGVVPCPLVTGLIAGNYDDDRNLNCQRF